MGNSAVASVALVTGIAGQDGSYLAELLIERGYHVVGTTRSCNPDRLANIAHILDQIELVEDDLLDQRRIERLLDRFQPSRIFNLAARTSSADFYSDPVATGEINGLTVTRLLEAVRLVNPEIRFFQALSSELFGFPKQFPQSELTPFQPENFYAVAKLYAYWTVKIYREQRGLHASCGILYNHESPRRDVHFVTRKITRAVAMIKAGRQEHLELGSLSVQRDWSFAGDFAQAFLLIVDHPKPDDYVLASGVSHSVMEFCEIAFARVGLDYRRHVVTSPNFLRTTDSLDRVGNPMKAESQLGWRRQVDFENLVSMMVDQDLFSIGKK